MMNSDEVCLFDLKHEEEFGLNVRKRCMMGTISEREYWLVFCVNVTQIRTTYRNKVLTSES